MIYSLITTYLNFPNASQVLLKNVSIVALLALTGCSTVPAAVQVETVISKTKVPQGKPKLPKPKPINLSSVKWKVLTPGTLPKGDYVFYGVTPKGYETLSRNRADTIRYAKETNWQLRYYRGDTK